MQEENIAYTTTFEYLTKLGRWEKMRRRIVSSSLLTTVALLATGCFAPALAADIASEALSVSADPVNPRAVLIQSVVDINGEIEPGDDVKLKDAFMDVWARRNTLIDQRHLKLYVRQNIVYLSSPGGAVDAALKLAQVLKQVETTGPTMVSVKGTCASVPSAMSTDRPGHAPVRAVRRSGSRAAGKGAAVIRAFWRPFVTY